MERGRGHGLGIPAVCRVVDSSIEAFSDALEDLSLMGKPREQRAKLGGAPLGFRHASRSP